MDNYYELRYKYKDVEVVHKFSSEIDLPTLADNLKYFLKGCSWTTNAVDELINGGI